MGSTESTKTFTLFEGDWQERLDHIMETMRTISRHEDPQEMVATYGLRMSDLAPSDRHLSVSRRGVKPPGYLIARDSDRKEQWNPWHDRDQLPRLEGGILGQMIYGNEPVYLNDFRVAEDDPAAHILRDYRCLAAIPVFDDGQALNMVVFLSHEPDALDPNLMPQMAWTANLFGRATNSLVLKNQAKAAHDALDREMKTIAEIQRSLLPERLPEIPTLELAAYYSPAARAGGDYYDFLKLADGKWAMIIADVAGHGSPAAVLMAVTHTLAHTPPTSCTDAAGLVDYINARITGKYTEESGTFVTAFVAVYDPATRKLTYSSAGHNPPRVKRCSDGSMFELDGAGGIPLGIQKDWKYEQTTIQLESGDQMILYTDGITESRNPAGDMFTEEGLDSVLTHCGIDAQALIGEVLDKLNAFTHNAEPLDDRTLVVGLVR